jgi:predicted RNA-binding protein
MCEATAYLQQEVIMQDVMSVEVVPGGVRLTTLFEPPRVVPARIREIDLIEHRVMLEPLGEPLAEPPSGPGSTG